MARILVTCDDCGDVETSSRDLRLRYCVDTQEYSYYFRCPICHMVESRRVIDLGVAHVLSVAGVVEETWHMPRELSERAGCKDPPLGDNDIIDLHFVLEQPDWYDRLLVAH